MKPFGHIKKTQNRQEAGRLLAKSISKYNLVDAVVVGVPRGGVVVAAEIADQLGLPLETMSCRPILDPSDRSRIVGSVSAAEASFHDYPRSLQDSLYLKTVTLRNEMRYENEFYHGGESTLNVELKTVILVDDMVITTDEISASLEEIKKQRPLKIIVAVPFITSRAADAIASLVDDLVYLKAPQSIQSPLEFYIDFPGVDDWTVRNLLQRSKRLLVPSAK